jgi:hypothetical protein
VYPFKTAHGWGPAAVAHPGSDTGHLAPVRCRPQEFDQRRRYYVQVGKRLGPLTREEQDRILEEYPRLVARLEEEHGL